MADRQYPPSFLHPMATGSLRHWMRLLRLGYGVEPSFWKRLPITTLACFGLAPLRFLEEILYGQAVADTSLTQPPLFILGHWRSGTTLLHELFCQDPAFAYVSMLQTIMPESSLLGKRWLRPLIAGLLPETRFMDDMSWSIDGPQEEEYGLAMLSLHAFYHAFTYPRQTRQFFDRDVLFRGADPDLLETWQRCYLAILRKATYEGNQRRLVLKSPPNTARIRHLLNLFPDAQFVFVVRNPYRVLASTRHFLRQIHHVSQLHRISATESDDAILYCYRELHQHYLADRHLIPPQNLVEITLESFNQDPLAHLESIYARLGLPTFAQAEPALRRYLDAQTAYTPNPFRLTQDVADRVNQHWAFALREWGYEQQEAV